MEIPVPYELRLILCPGEDHRKEQRSLFPTTDLRWEPVSAFVELRTSKCQHALVSLAG